MIPVRMRWTGVAALIWLMAGCIHYPRPVQPGALTEQRLGKVRVVMRDGARIRLANAEVRADTLFGHGAVPASAGVRGDQAIPLSDVASVARARVSLVRTGAAVLAGTAVTWVTVGFILLSAADFDF